MEIGLKIKELMVKEKIDIPELAKKLGKTKQAIYDMLEKKDVNTSLLRDLSSIFNVPISIFFEEEPITNNTTGNSNIVVGRDNNGQISAIDCRKELEEAKLEIKHLKERLKDKEEMIEILKKQLDK